MAHDQPVGPAGEAAVGDQRDRVAQPRADDGGRGRQHLAHARARRGALRSGSRSRRPARICRARIASRQRLLGLEDPRRSGDPRLLHAGDLRDRSLRGQVAAEHREVSLGVERTRPGPDHVLVGPGLVRQSAERLGHRLAADRERVAVQQPVSEQQLHHLRHAAGRVQVGGHVAARRLEVAQHRHAGADRLEVVDRERHAGGVRDGEQVQHGVGAAAERHGHADGVLERLPGEDLRAGRSPRRMAADQHLARAGRAVGLLGVLGRHGGRAAAGSCPSPRSPRTWCWR